MEYWEFLLQQEGDRSWLPLESPDVEILEGRYRVAARSSLTNTQIEIRITHQSTQEDPPKRRTQKRSHTTNQDGLVVIFPFTQLKPGVWEIRCLEQVAAGKSPWQSWVRLQVLSKLSDDFSDWEPDWQSNPTDTGSEAVPVDPLSGSNAVQEVLPTVEALPSYGDQEPLPLIHEALAHEALAHEVPEDVPSVEIPVPQKTLPLESWISEASRSPLEPETILSAQPISTHAVFHLNVSQATYFAQWGKDVAISGKVSLQNPDLAGGEPSSLTAWTGEIQICLRDPQNGEILVDFWQPITQQILPFPFTYTLTIPPTCKTRLILGEIILYGITASEATPLAVLATQAFTVAANLDELLEVLAEWNEKNANPLNEEDFLDLPLDSGLDSSDNSSELSLGEPDLLEVPQTTPTFRFQPSNNQPLPPQLYQPNPDKETPKSLDLPNFPRPQPPTADLGMAEAESPQLDVADKTDDSIELDPVTAPDPLDTDTSADSALLGSNPPDLEDSDIEKTIGEEEDEPISSTDRAFQSLKLQERFLSRLNNLATDLDLSEWLKTNFPSPVTTVSEGEGVAEGEVVAEGEGEEEEKPVGEEIEPTLAGENEATPTLVRPVEQEAEQSAIPEAASTSPWETEDPWIAQEVVVDDDDLPAPKPSIQTQPMNPQIPVEDNPLSEDQPVPIPHLEVSSGELISGEAVTVRVKLATSLARICVKVWISDRQTRSLLDGPRWMIEFTPDNSGNLEAETEFIVPFGTLEIRFEAIALELHTQRESNKVTLEKAVVPPNIPSLLPDEWDD
ncbi:MAG: hypothetical protein VKJ46_00230 [Leptolyngbyaceae bacterium]|nr:hypothetical protein [Leptolyngbyaceae bacterium]